MIILRQKIFFNYGITSSDISSYAKSNNISVKDALGALEKQRAAQGIGQEAFKAGDKSLFRADTIKATKDSAGVLGKSQGGQFGINKYKASATSSSAANMKFNKAYNAGMSTGMKAGQQSATMRTALTNSWNKMGTMGKVGTVAAIAGTTALAAKGAMSMFGNNKKED